MYISKKLFRKIIESSFKLGENWGVTYSTWFTPTEKQTSDKIEDAMNLMQRDPISQETIVCSAVYFDDGQSHIDQPYNIETGFVVSGRRHRDCYATLNAFKNMSDRNSKTIDEAINDSTETAGFVTSDNRFVDRIEAWKIAMDAGQISYGCTKPMHDMDGNPIEQELISEHLWNTRSEEYEPTFK